MQTIAAILESRDEYIRSLRDYEKRWHGVPGGLDGTTQYPGSAS